MVVHNHMFFKVNTVCPNKETICKNVVLDYFFSSY